MTAVDSAQSTPADAPTAAPIASEQMPERHGSRAVFIVGGIGMPLVLIGANLLWILYFFPSFLAFYTVSFPIMSVGATLGAIAFLGYRVNYHSSMGLATGVITFIFAWWMPVFYLVRDVIGAVFGILGFVITGVLFITAMEFLGVMWILWGSAMSRVRHHTGHSGLGVAAGVLFIVAGSFWCSLFLWLAASALLIPACIVGMVSLFISRIG